MLPQRRQRVGVISPSAAILAASVASLVEKSGSSDWTARVVDGCDGSSVVSVADASAWSVTTPANGLAVNRPSVSEDAMLIAGNCAEAPRLSYGREVPGK